MLASSVAQMGLARRPSSRQTPRFCVRRAGSWPFTPHSCTAPSLHHARHSAPLSTPTTAHSALLLLIPLVAPRGRPRQPPSLDSTHAHTPIPPARTPHARDLATRPAPHTPARYPALPSAPRVAPPQTGCLSPPATASTRSRVSREYSTFAAVTHSTTAFHRRRHSLHSRPSAASRSRDCRGAIDVTAVEIAT